MKILDSPLIGLAKAAGINAGDHKLIMSVANGNRTFKSLTAKQPDRYQKALRIRQYHPNNSDDFNVAEYKLMHVHFFA